MYGVIRAKQFERSIRKLEKSGVMTARLRIEIRAFLGEEIKQLSWLQHLGRLFYLLPSFAPTSPRLRRAGKASEGKAWMANRICFSMAIGENYLTL